MHPDLQYEEFFDWMDEVRSPFTDLVYDRIVGKRTGAFKTAAAAHDVSPVRE